MDEKTRAELVEWLDPEGLWTKSEIIGENPCLSYLIAYTCQSLWMSGGAFAADHGLDGDDEYAEEVARIIAEHILMAVVNNDTFGSYKDVMCRHLMGVLAKELMNGRHQN